MLSLCLILIKVLIQGKEDVTRIVLNALGYAHAVHVRNKKRQKVQNEVKICLTSDYLLYCLFNVGFLQRSR